MTEGECSNSQSLGIDISAREPRNAPSKITIEGTSVCRIFKVPEQYIRADNAPSFHPKILSIGPYHHGSSHLRGMELVKSSCQHYILGCISENYYDRDEIKRLESKARSFYGENIEMEPNKFAEMLLLDGCFILASLTKRKGMAVENAPNKTAMSSQGTSSSDTMAHSRGGEWQVDLKQHEALHREDTARDLFLLENQIPFFVVEKIHELAAGEKEATESPRKEIAEYVKGVLKQYPKAFEISDICLTDFHHLLHLCHMFFRPSPDPVPHNQATIQCLCCFPDSHHMMNQWHRAMQYYKAGVEFRVKPSSVPHSLLDVTFSNGIMIIPHLSIDAKTESIFSNLIVFEQGCPHARKYINAYVTFMSQLLSDADDVELLVQRGIIEILGRKEEALNIFSRLNGLARFDPRGEDYYLKSTLQSVEAHYDFRLNWWMAWLKHNHLANPCVALAALGGFIVLLCTVIQALFSVLQFFIPPK